MQNKGQLLIEAVLGLLLLTVILGVLATFIHLLYQTSRYLNFNQSVALAGFEKYRNALISMAQTNWDLFDSLATNTEYFLIASGNQWVISSGSEVIISGQERYEFNFMIGDYTTSSIKMVTTTSYFGRGKIVLKDYFLLPKLNVNF